MQSKPQFLGELLEIYKKSDPILQSSQIQTIPQKQRMIKQISLQKIYEPPTIFFLLKYKPIEPSIC